MTLELVARLRAYRKAKGISQRMLSERSGYSRTQLSQWERDYRTISLAQFMDLCDALGVRIELKEKQ